MVIIALNCIVRDYRNRNLHHYLLPPTKSLGKSQKADGSFGGVKTTALVLQALQATDPGGQFWNKTAAIQFLKSKQNWDGSFGDEKDVDSTIMALLALGPRSLANIKDLNCHPDSAMEWSVFPLADLTMTTNYSLVYNNIFNTSKSEETTTAQSSTVTATTSKTTIPVIIEKKNNNGKITVSYTLWIGNNSSSIRTLNISTEVGSNFYHVMQLAAQLNDQFIFQSTEWPNGHYIHTLAGYKEDPMSYHYWLLYRLPTLPDMGNPPTNHYVAPLGVDDLIVRDKDIFLFWYKKL